MYLRYVFYSAFFVSVFLSLVFAEDDEDEMCECILLGITDDVVSCGGWEDAPIQVAMKMKLEEGEGDMPDTVKLAGNIAVDDEVSSGYNININIYADTANGKDLVWSGGAEVCQSMSDKDAPWYPLLEPFNTTECPIVKGKYEAPGMYLTMNFMDDFLTTDFIGNYLLAITMEHAADKIMCLEIGAEIYQEDRPCKYCPGSNKNKDDRK